MLGSPEFSHQILRNALSCLEPSVLCCTAQVSKHLSVECAHASLWSRLYDRRWNTRLGIANPTQADYRQRHLAATHRWNTHKPDTYTFALEMTSEPGREIVFAGSVTLTLAPPRQRIRTKGEPRTKLPEPQAGSFQTRNPQFVDGHIVIQNNVKSKPGKEFDDRFFSGLRATLTLLRHSDQAMTCVWSNIEPGDDCIFGAFDQELSYGQIGHRGVLDWTGSMDRIPEGRLCMETDFLADSSDEFGLDRATITLCVQFFHYEIEVDPKCLKWESDLLDALSSAAFNWRHRV